MKVTPNLFLVLQHQATSTKATKYTTKSTATPNNSTKLPILRPQLHSVRRDALKDCQGLPDRKCPPPPHPATTQEASCQLLVSSFGSSFIVCRNQGLKPPNHQFKPSNGTLAVENNPFSEWSFLFLLLYVCFRTRTTCLPRVNERLLPISTRL